MSKTLVRLEINQAWHRLAFRALWKWPDRATLEREVGSLSRRLNAGQRWVVKLQGRLGHSRVLCIF